MSILDRLKKKPEGKKKLFGIVAGQRLAGKSTLAGTLPGKSLLLQAAVLESGSESAEALAKRAGNELAVLTFTTLDDLANIIVELGSDKTFDNVYVDSLSAVTELKYREPEIQKLLKKDNWAAFREIGETVTECIVALKALTYPDMAAKAKNVFMAMALDVKHDRNGEVNEVSLVAKGNVAVSNVTKFGEAVLTIIAPEATENGETGYKLITKTQGWWPGRIDGVLRESNPGVIEPASLTEVIKLKEGAKNV